MTRRNRVGLGSSVFMVLILAGAVALLFWRFNSSKEAGVTAAAPLTATSTETSAASPKLISSSEPSVKTSDVALPSQTPARAQTHPRAAADSAASAPPVKTLGNKNAPIAMEVFSDYQCPACRGLFEQTLRPMINDYVAQGKVYLIHRDFPLPLAVHTHSWEAARWANAAAKIGKFQDVDAALFDNQLLWSGSGDIEKYVSAALNATDFKRVQTLMAGSCMNDPGPVLNPANLAAGPSGGHACALDNYIEQDVNLGKQIPVNQTPTMAITYKGQKYPATSGLITWPILKEYFDSLLSQ